MAYYFFDTSALVKRHVDESGCDWVRSLTHRRSEHTIFLSAITAVEMVAAMTRRQRGGSLTVHQAGAILSHFRRHMVDRYFVLELSQAYLDASMLLSRKHGLRAYDAVQLATALGVNRANQIDGFGPVTLVSADRELNAAALAEKMIVDDPNLHP